ncbi:MAG: FAD-dependent oxidoreductase [Bacteroidia bacterium]
MNLSFWEKEMAAEVCDVLITGVGIVGLSTALELKLAAPSLKIRLIDRGILPSGGSTKNAGFACFGSLSELADDFETMPENEVFRLVKKRFDGLQNLRKILGDDAIEYSACGGYELFRTGNDNSLKRSLAILPKMNEFMLELCGVSAVYSDASHQIDSFGFNRVEQLILNKLEGSIHTGKMMNALRCKVQELGVDILMGIGITGIGLQNEMWEAARAVKPGSSGQNRL